jgi:hypothetical protein
MPAFMIALGDLADPCKDCVPDDLLESHRKCVTDTKDNIFECARIALALIGKMNDEKNEREREREKRKAEMDGV